MDRNSVLLTVKYWMAGICGSLARAGPLLIALLQDLSAQSESKKVLKCYRNGRIRQLSTEINIMRMDRSFVLSVRSSTEWLGFTEAWPGPGYHYFLRCHKIFRLKVDRKRSSELFALSTVRLFLVVRILTAHCCPIGVSALRF